MFERLLDRLIRRAARLSGSVADPAVESADRLIAQGNGEESAGNVQEACALYRRAVAAAPGYAKAHLNLGIGLEAGGDADGAARSYERTLAIDPAEPYAHYNLGKLLYARGVHDAAERHLRASIAARPDLVEAHVALSNLLDSKAMPEPAARELETALRLRPDYFGALYNYGMILLRQGRPAEAEAAFRRAVALDPRSEPALGEAYLALYRLCRSRGDVAAATAALQGMIERWPDRADLLYEHALLLKKQWRLADAEAALRRAIAIDPRSISARRELAGVFLAYGRVEEALEAYEEAQAFDPGDSDAARTESFVSGSAGLFARNFSEKDSAEELFAGHKALAARLERDYPPRFASFPNVVDPERRLRIGYVSGEFRYHPVTLFAIPLIENHDRSGYEVYCYSLGDEADEFTEQVSRRADAWRPSASMPRDAVADAVYGDRIDILVDLSGHSGVSTLQIFARRPAPVQATWLGYLNTSGMTRIQYRLCDAHTDPPGLTERFHTEALVRLPGSQWCYRPFVSVDCAATPPFESNGRVTFGSFNQFAKISAPVRALWAEILARVPDSRLVVLGVPEGPCRDALLEDLRLTGAQRSRATLVSHVPLQEYFGWLNAVDVALDTLPYSGGTTTCDALWMGVPVLTLPGSRSASRSAASILSAVGLRDWIASSPAGYVRRAAQAADDLGALRALRGSLRGRMRDSALMDEPRFARDVENAYRGMWRAWCAAAR
jgi:protein O-GlcNAc transferase